MTNRDYYQFRHGADRPELTFDMVLRMLVAAFIDMERNGWFAFLLGRACVDEQADMDEIIRGRMLEMLGFEAWPLNRLQESYRRGDGVELIEDEAFSLTEFLYDHAAKPTNTRYHGYPSYGPCGIHVDNADETAGKAEFAERINGILSRCGHELRSNGEVWQSAPTGLETLDPERTGNPLIDNKVNHAIAIFRRRGATEEDKRDAIKNLADIFEARRSSIEGTRILREDEDRLFEIANNFGIRHFNQKQKIDYDSGVWLEWIFYSFLNTIDLMNKLANRGGRQHQERAVSDEMDDLPF